MAKRIYVGNLPFNSNKAQLEKLFGRYGEIAAVHLPGDRNRPDSGSIEFKDPKAAVAAMKALNGFRLGENRLEITDRDRD